jgi:hypothetical protein
MVEYFVDIIKHYYVNALAAMEVYSNEFLIMSLGGD